MPLYLHHETLNWRHQGQESSGTFNNATINRLDGGNPHRPSYTGLDELDQYGTELGVGDAMANPQLAAFVESAWPSETAFQSHSWPWLYEDMYLQSTPNMDVEMFDTSQDAFGTNAMSSVMASQMTPVNSSQFSQGDLGTITGAGSADWQFSTLPGQDQSHRVDLRQRNQELFDNHMTISGGSQPERQLSMSLNGTSTCQVTHLFIITELT